MLRLEIKSLQTSLEPVMSKDTAREEEPDLEKEAKSRRNAVSTINVKAPAESELVSREEMERASRFALTPLAKNEAEGRQETEKENPWLGDQIPEEKYSQEQMEEDTLKSETKEPDLT